MRRLGLCVAVLVAVLATGLLGQQPLNDDAIVKMHKAGLDDDFIVDIVNTRPGHYALGVDDIIALKQAGISKKVISAMLNRSGAPVAPSPTPQAATGIATVPAAAPQAPTPGMTVAQAGRPADFNGVVFVAKGDQWMVVPTEPVEWKIGGGKFKEFASAGMVKREVFGALSGASSPTTLKAPQFLLYAPQNVAVTQYHLVHLHPRADGRDFLAVREDDFSVHGTRDVVAFESKEVRSHWFMITLAHLDPGEYGWIPPEVAAGNESPDEHGKMFTFHLVE